MSFFLGIWGLKLGIWIFKNVRFYPVLSIIHQDSDYSYEQFSSDFYLPRCPQP